ncbi:MULTISPECIES: hypothetical protein [unclassified Actinobaculum]|uniref:hypothetical protein n=1 Tax=unclassified Actinobaculum TaxID=2609299 RepID=UPI000D526F68|nr:MULTISPECIES: hypothetical protein [unclassified Actinobaculum]AWE42597.1 hypothetical protein DDD63_07365 [Actinobaculum sp. 313]RTE48107.1 hypothetical protein EKN07_10860 [Actinobaculum sp. 352]
MAATPARSVRSEARPVVQGLPSLELVPTPAPVRGFVGTVIACLALFLGAFGVVFFLNTQLVSTAYEIQSVHQEINAATAKEATLQDELVDVSTPQGLTAKAKQLGLVPATEIQHLDLATGSVIAPVDSEGN